MLIMFFLLLPKAYYMYTNFHLKHVNSDLK